MKIPDQKYFWIPQDIPDFFYRCIRTSYKGLEYFNKHLMKPSNAQLFTNLEHTIDGWPIFIVKSGTTNEYTVVISGTNSLRNWGSDFWHLIKGAEKTVKVMKKWVEEIEKKYNIKVSYVTGHSEGGYLACLLAAMLKCIAVTFNGRNCPSNPYIINLREPNCLVSGGPLSNKENYIEIPYGSGGHASKDIGWDIKPYTRWEDLIPPEKIKRKPSPRLNRAGISGRGDQPALAKTAELSTNDPELTLADNIQLATVQESEPVIREVQRVPVGERRTGYFDGVAATSLSSGAFTAVSSFVFRFLLQNESGETQKKKKEVVLEALNEGVETGLVSGFFQFVSNVVIRKGITHSSSFFVSTALTLYHGAKKIYQISTTEEKRETPPTYLHDLEASYSNKERALATALSRLTQEEKEIFFTILAKGNHEQIQQVKRILFQRSHAYLIHIFIKYLWGMSPITRPPQFFAMEISLSVVEIDTGIRIDQENVAFSREGPHVFDQEKMLLRNCSALKLEEHPSLLLVEMETEEARQLSRESARLTVLRMQQVALVVAEVGSTILFGSLLSPLAAFFVSILASCGVSKLETGVDEKFVTTERSISLDRIQRLDDKIGILRTRIKEIKKIKSSRSLLWKIVRTTASCLKVDLESDLNRELAQLRTAKFYLQIQKVDNNFSYT